MFQRVAQELASHDSVLKTHGVIFLGNASDKNDPHGDIALALLVSRLSIEENLGVQETILSSINKFGINALPYLIKTNINAANEISRTVGRIVAIEAATKTDPYLVIGKLLSDDKVINGKMDFEHRVIDRLDRRLHDILPFPTLSSPLIVGPFNLELLLLSPKYNDVYYSNAYIQLSSRTRESNKFLLDKEWTKFDAAARSLGATSLALAELLRTCPLTRNLNLDGIVLIDGDFRDCNFNGASFQNAYIRGLADNANFSRCNLKSAVLANLKVSGAKFNDAKLDNTKFMGNKLDDVSTLESANWWKAESIYFDVSTSKQTNAIVYDLKNYTSSTLSKKYPPTTMPIN